MTGDLTPDQIDVLLREEATARLGCHADGQTYVVPITYAYDGVALIAHSAEGRKVRMMRVNPDVCVEVDRVDGLDRWRSVIAWGRYEELRGAAAQEALATLVARFTGRPGGEALSSGHGASGAGPPSLAAGHPPPAVVYRIRLGERTGRYERPGPTLVDL